MVAALNITRYHQINNENEQEVSGYLLNRGWIDVNVSLDVLPENTDPNSAGFLYDEGGIRSFSLLLPVGSCVLAIPHNT